MNDILPIILRDTFTLNRLKDRIRALKANLIKNFFGGTDDLQPAVSDLNWLSSLPQSLYTPFTKDNIYKIFEDIDNQIQRMQVLTIYLTFEPDEVTSAQIGTFARKTFGSTLLLDIKLNPALIAGCSLSWKGRLRDYSLRAQLEEKKGEILENFKKFLR